MSLDTRMRGAELGTAMAIVAVAFLVLGFVVEDNPGGVRGTDFSQATAFGTSLEGDVAPAAQGEVSHSGWDQISVPSNVGSVTFADKQIVVTYSGFLNMPAMKVYDMNSLPFSGFEVQGAFTPGTTCLVGVDRLTNGTLFVQIRQSQ